MAFELAIIGILVGIVLGLRYKVLVLVHAVMFAINFSIIIGIARAESFWSIVLTTAAVVTAVQVGYLAGLGIHAAIASIRAPQNGDGKPDSKIGHSGQPIWQSDGWADCVSLDAWAEWVSLDGWTAEWGSIVSLHPLLPPQA
jgi:hypothetical protein